MQVKFTEDEYRMIVVRAAAANLTVPSYLALTGLRPEGVAVSDAKSALTNLTGVRRVLAGVASNLNQLTAKLHSTGEVDDSLAGVLVAVQRISVRTDEAVADLATVVTGGPR